MTRIFIDCEFNGFGGELISMALVTDCGKEWYEVLPTPSNRPYDQWVVENVFPVLGQPSIPADEWRASFIAFLEQFNNPTIVADWYTDVVHFFQCFAGQDHSESFEYPCCVELVTDLPSYAPEVPHNALSDARAIRKALIAEGEG